MSGSCMLSAVRVSPGPSSNSQSRKRGMSSERPSGFPRITHPDSGGSRHRLFVS